MELNSSDNKSQDAVGKITGFFLFRNVINKYNEEKDYDEEKRKSIKKYGLTSLILSFIALAISLGCLISTLSNINLFGFSYVVMVIVFVLGGFFLSLVLSLYGFVFAVMQVRLNRKSIGIIGLIFSILGVISSILLIIFMFV